MVIVPKTRGFICTTAHPTGCANNVYDQITYASEHKLENAPKRVLVVGSSTGYGLASRITAAFSADADTIGVFFERAASGPRTATAGWYNNQAFEKAAKEKGLVHTSLNGDAFSDEMKQQVIDTIRAQMPQGQIDMIIYSLAAPRRKDPKSDFVWSSALKPIGAPFSSKTVDFHTGIVSDVTIEPANEEEIEGTIKVMGGEDWLLWIEALKEADVLAPHVSTVAYSYIGPELTHPIYTQGTIGQAKKDLEIKASQITTILEPLQGHAFVSVNKALVTQASNAIPVVPLYISILLKVMQEAGTDENCIQQIVRMFHRIFQSNGNWDEISVDSAGRLRLDDWEMEPAIQEKVMEIWPQITTENVKEKTALDLYSKEYYHLYGFQRDDVDYTQDVEV